MPNKLVSLYCPRNCLTFISSIPPTLEYLYCHDNNLDSLPLIPASLAHIECRNNNFAEIRLEKILLNQHNQRRADLGLSPVKSLVEVDFKDTWHRWTLLQYQLDSEEYNKAAKEIIE